MRVQSKCCIVIRNCFVSGLPDSNLLTESEDAEKSVNQQETGAVLASKELKALTKCNASGEVYRRSAVVSAQLEAVLLFDKTDLTAALNVKSRDDTRFLREETLVYLMREAIVEGDFELSEAVASTLYRRCEKSAARRVRRAIDDETTAADVAADALGALFGLLGDVTTDKADFAQVRFNLLAKRIINNHVVKARKRLRQMNLTDSIDDTGDDGDDNISPRELAAAPEIWDVENSEFAAKALAILPPDIRTAFILRHQHGWQIESDDPNEPTLAKRFKKTPRTIRNWMNKADELLADWRDKQQKQ